MFRSLVVSGSRAGTNCRVYARACMHAHAHAVPGAAAGEAVCLPLGWRLCFTFRPHFLYISCFL